MAETSEDPPKKPRDPKDGPDPRSDIRGDYFETRRAVFLEHLALTSSVKQSADLAEIPNSTLYFWRERYPDFAAEWLKALAAGYELLEMEMLERARNGVERTIYYHGEKVATVRDYDNKMALQLLRMHKEAVALVRAVQAELAEEAKLAAEPVRDTLDERLKKANVRLRAYQAEKRREQRGLKGDGGDVVKDVGNKQSSEEFGTTFSGKDNMTDGG